MDEVRSDFNNSALVKPNPAFELDACELQAPLAFGGIRLGEKFPCDKVGRVAVFDASDLEITSRSDHPPHENAFVESAFVERCRSLLLNVRIVEGDRASPSKCFALRSL
eukprot:5755337-Amphidinium_carterae.1